MDNEGLVVASGAVGIGAGFLAWALSYTWLSVPNPAAFGIGLGTCLLLGGVCLGGGIFVEALLKALQR